MLSKTSKATIEAFEKGYRVIDGEVFSPKKKKLKLILNKSNYFYFSIRLETGQRYVITVHKLVAYQKFGIKAFEEKVEVRHLDSNSKNNIENNINIGTAKENAQDKLPSVRLKAAINAASFVKIYNHESIIKRRNEGASYKEIMKEFNISSKGTLSFIINKSQSVGNR